MGCPDFWAIFFFSPRGYMYIIRKKNLMNVMNVMQALVGGGEGKPRLACFCFFVIKFYVPMDG